MISSNAVDQLEPVTWWSVLWGFVMVGLLTVLFFLPFRWWAILALALFGTMEIIGVINSHRTTDYYPPLTDMLYKYVPFWGTMTGIFAFAGWSGAYWRVWAHPFAFGVWLGLLGWFVAHFINRYKSS